MQRILLRLRERFFIQKLFKNNSEKRDLRFEKKKNYKYKIHWSYSTHQNNKLKYKQLHADM